MQHLSKAERQLTLLGSQPDSVVFMYAEGDRRLVIPYPLFVVALAALVEGDNIFTLSEPRDVADGPSVSAVGTAEVEKMEDTLDKVRLTCLANFALEDSML